MSQDAPQTKVVTSERVACDGGGKDGHPRVWLHIPKDRGWVECPYCDCKFVRQDHAGAVN